MVGWPPSAVVCPAASYSPTWSPGSTIGAEGLSFRVRNGAGRFPFAMTAVTLSSCVVRDGVGVSRPFLGNRTVDASISMVFVASCRLISTGQLQASLVRTSTSGLSTQWSSWEPLTRGHGNLILKRASRLDAFSGYPFRT